MRRAAAAIAAVSGACAIALALVAASAWPRPVSEIDAPPSTPRSASDIVPPVRAGVTAEKITTQSTDPGDVARQVRVAPTRMWIDAIGLDMAVLPVGLTESGEMEIPAHASDAGWYKFAAAPGDASGTTLIAAHVDDAFQGRGPFSRLRDLSAGDVVTVSLSDGTSRDFVVYQRHQTAKTVVDFDQVFAQSKGMLVLVTCGGRWDRGTQHYEDNVIVWAAPTSVP